MRYEFFKLGDRTVGYDISLEDSIGRSLMGYVMIIALFAFVGGLLASIIPLVLFVMYFYSINKQKWLISLLGAAVSFYFLYDYSNGWICHKIFVKVFNSPNWLNDFAILNLGLLMSHVGLFVNSLTVMEDNDELPSKSNIFIIIAAIVMMVFSYTLTKNGVIKQYVEPVKVSYTC